MCGINGTTHPDPEAIKRMSAETSHRGPDYLGFFTDKDIAISHNLLSIRGSGDISKQPYSLDERWVLSFNGQIYNTERLIREHNLNPDENLRNLDTYILNLLIQKVGIDFCKYIHGMFAIALYDRIQKKLWLFRDPSGQKPLYFYNKGGIFAFSSEIKAILSLADVDNTTDDQAIALSCSLGYLPGDRTIFKHIKKLNPSQFLCFDLKSHNLALNYFRPETSNYYAEMDELQALESLVDEHLQSKAEISINLSGGLDSSIIASLASKSGRQIYSYTTFFENCDPSYNQDAELARKMTKDFNFKHSQLNISHQDYLDNFIESYEAVEEPNYNISLPAYLITAKAEGINGDKLRVVLSGDGGDEIFGGYTYYQELQRQYKMMRLLTYPIYNFLKSLKRKEYMHFENPVSRWLFFKKFKTEFLSAEINNEILSKELTEIINPEIISKLKNKGPINQAMLLDRSLWLNAENFIRSDKIFMTQSMEMRCPFAFQPFRDYIDSRFTDKDYFKNGQNKFKIRGIVNDILPDYISKRPIKTGWRSPIESWYDNKTKNLFLEILPNKDSNLIKWSKVKRLVQNSDKWPGKVVHLYLSLAILSEKFKINL